VHRVVQHSATRCTHNWARALQRDGSSWQRTPRGDSQVQACVPAGGALLRVRLRSPPQPLLAMQAHRGVVWWGVDHQPSCCVRA
jgi:hypothetical protein